MGSAYLWIKALHVVFVVSWFAGLFYLPRIYVNLAMVDDDATRSRLLLMARKLLVFMTGLAVIAVVLGMWLLGQGSVMDTGWMQTKLLLVLLLIAYHGWCGVLYSRFAHGGTSRSHVWFRWFNEIPVLLLTAIVVLAVVKPF
jgi:protoporphyrinogen IX oxidase